MGFGTIVVLVILGIVLLLFVGGIIVDALEESEDKRTHKPENHSEDSP